MNLICFSQFLIVVQASTTYWSQCSSSQFCSPATSVGTVSSLQDCFGECARRNGKYASFQSASKACYCSNTCTYGGQTPYSVWVLIEDVSKKYAMCGDGYWCDNCPYLGYGYSVQSCSTACNSYSHFFIAGNGDGHCSCCNGCRLSANSYYDVYRNGIVCTSPPSSHPLTRWNFVGHQLSPNTLPHTSSHTLPHPLRRNSCRSCSSEYWCDDDWSKWWWERGFTSWHIDLCLLWSYFLILCWLCLF